MNMDKEITLSDVLMLAKEVLNEQNNAMADANRDGKASLADVMFLSLIHILYNKIKSQYNCA